MLSATGTRSICQYSQFSRTVNATTIPMTGGSKTILTTSVLPQEQLAKRFDETCLRYCYAYLTPYCAGYAVKASGVTTILNDAPSCFLYGTEAWMANLNTIVNGQEPLYLRQCQVVTCE